MQRARTSAVCLSILWATTVHGAADTDDVGPPPDSPEASTAATSPLTPLPLRLCSTSYVAPAAWPGIDPVGLLAGAASACTVGTSSAPCAPHRVYTPSPLREREPLFLFLPGTNMEPDKHDLVLMTAASTGYRAIGLSYDNTESVEDACAGLEECGLDCQNLVRGEAVRGVNLTSQVTVARGDSVLVRLYRLLENLDTIDPTGGWSSYYVPTAGNITPDSIVWSNIIVGGFSQGAGHAAWISRIRQVHGLFLLDGANDSCIDPATGDELPAEWLTTGSDASAGRPKYAYRHDHGTGDTTTAVAWQEIGLGTTLVDGDTVQSIPPARATVTAQGHPAAPAICSDHTSMARDACMPTDLAGATAATAPADARLYTEYALRMCYACDATTCP